MSTFPLTSERMSDIVEQMKRRRHQNGSVFDRSGSWYLQYRLYDAQGIEDKKTVRLGPAKGNKRGLKPITEKEAWRIAETEHLQNVDFTNTHPSSGMTVSEFWEGHFYPDHVANLRASGKEGYTYLFKNHVEPRLGQAKLSEMTFIRIQALLNAKAKEQHHQGCPKAAIQLLATKEIVVTKSPDEEIEKDYSPSIKAALALLRSGADSKVPCDCPTYSPQTLRHIRNVISALMGHAKRCQLFTGDLPTEGVRLPEPAAPEKRPLSWDQVVALSAEMGLKECMSDKFHGERVLSIEQRNEVLAILVRLLCRTGLRIGEMMGLRWKYVNLSDEPIQIDGGWLGPKTIAVRWGFVRGEWGALKTRSSKRDVPLDTIAYADICQLRDIMHSVGLLEIDKPAFCSDSGTPLSAHNIAARFLKPAAARAGVPWASWHVMRHTWASLADQAGLSVSERQKILGHAAGSMTLHYTHADLGEARKGMDKIGAASGMFAGVKEQRIAALKAALAELEKDENK